MNENTCKTQFVCCGVMIRVIHDVKNKNCDIILGLVKSEFVPRVSYLASHGT